MCNISKKPQNVPVKFLFRLIKQNVFYRKMLSFVSKEIKTVKHKRHKSLEHCNFIKSEIIPAGVGLKFQKFSE